MTEEESNPSKTKCKHCKEPIEIEASICHHCCQYQGKWSRFYHSSGIPIISILAVIASWWGAWQATQERADAEAALEASKKASVLIVEMASILTIDMETNPNANLNLMTFSLQHLRPRAQGLAKDLQEITEFETTQLTSTLTEDLTEEQEIERIREWADDQKSPSNL